MVRELRYYSVAWQPPIAQSERRPDPTAPAANRRDRHDVTRLAWASQWVRWVSGEGADERRLRSRPRTNAEYTISILWMHHVHDTHDEVGRNTEN